MSEFEKYARKHCGISSLKLHDFQSISAAYVSPTIIEERQLNVATMDVFSRFLMVSSEYTVPDGLFGELIMTPLVCSLILSSRASKSI